MLGGDTRADTLLLISFSLLSLSLVFDNVSTSDNCADFSFLTLGSAADSSVSILDFESSSKYFESSLAGLSDVSGQLGPG